MAEHVPFNVIRESVLIESRIFMRSAEPFSFDGRRLLYLLKDRSVYTRSRITITDSSRAPYCMKPRTLRRVEGCNVELS